MKNRLKSTWLTIDQDWISRIRSNFGWCELRRNSIWTNSSEFDQILVGTESTEFTKFSQIFS